MDIFIEQSVNNSQIDKRKRLFTILRVLRYICFGIVAVLVLLFWISPIAEGTGIGGILLNALFYILMMLPFIGAGIFIKRYINNKNAEYDYFIMGSTFRIVKVINRIKRRLLIETECSSIESVGKVGSESYERYASNKAIKKIIALCDYENDDELVYLYYVKDGNPFLLHISPDANMLSGIRRSVSRITVLDKSLNTPVKKNDIS